MDEFERTIGELESLFVDPQFKAFLDEVRLYNELLQAKPTTDADAQAVVEDLNDRWMRHGYYGRTVHVTGGMYIGGNHDDIRYEPLSDANLARDMKAYPMKSTGFSFISVPVERDGVLAIEQELVMRGRIEFEDDEGVDGVSNEKCAVRVTDTLIECREMTPQKAAAWLDVYYAEPRKLIDESILKADDEAGAAMNLGQVTLPIAEGSKKDAKTLRRVLKTYLKEYLSFEQYIPYRAVLIGEMRTYDPQSTNWDTDEIILNYNSTIAIHGVDVRLNRELQQYDIWLSATLVGKGKKDFMIIEFPLETLVSLESGRELFGPEPHGA